MGSEYSAAAYTVMEVEAMLAAGVQGVKTIKRGIAEWTSLANKVVTTGATVDINKTMVLLESNLSGAVTGMSLGSGEYGLVYHSLLSAISSTTITLTPCYAQVGSGSGNRVYGQCYWQVIEFY